MTEQRRAEQKQRRKDERRIDPYELIKALERGDANTPLGGIFIKQAVKVITLAMAEVKASRKVDGAPIGTMQSKEYTQLVEELESARLDTFAALTKGSLQ